MKVLVLGCNGYLGSSFLKVRPDWDGSDVEITDPAQVAAELEKVRPDVVLNCAGKTGRPNIDWCERNPAATLASNVTGPLVVLNECLSRDIRLVHIGSGCIYGGDNLGRGFAEHDPPNYRGSLYSRTKILADQALSEFDVLILRLRMPFDGSEHPRNLINRLAGYRHVLDAPNSLSCLPEFMEAASALIDRRCTGIFHIVNPGVISPYQVMATYQRIVDPVHHCERLSARALDQHVSTGRSNCVLSQRKLNRLGIRLTNVEQAIENACHEMKKRVLA